MKYRQAEILAATQITTAGTKMIGINIADPISRILILVELTNNGYAGTGHPVWAIKKIDIVDGSEVICSLEGFQAQAAAFYTYGYQDHSELNYENNAVIRAAISIPFGRHLYDELLALDPNKFKNLSLKIEHDYALGGCTPDDAYLSVFADVFDKKTISPLGYLMTKEHYSYTPADGATEYIALPTDHPIKFLMPIAGNDNEEPDIQFETIKVSEENDKTVVFNLKCMQAIRMYCQMYPKWSEYFSGRIHTTPVSHWLTPGKDLCFSIPDSESSDTYNWVIWSGGQLRKLDTGAIHTFQGNVEGICPHGAVILPCGKQDVIDDWWDAQALGSARMALTGRNAAGGGVDTNKTTDLVIQQFHRY